MDMDIEDSSNAKGSGKSTFCEHVTRGTTTTTRSWVRICQDTISNGKSGTKQQCLKSAAAALKEGKSVFIDRCNLEKEQRAEFVKLGGPHVDIHAVVLDLPAQLCISRSVKRTGHEGNLQGGRAAAVVNKMLQKKELPKINEGFYRIMVCQTVTEVDSAVTIYSKLGPLDTLPTGYFGPKNPEPKVQAGIMNFFKKVQVPPNVDLNKDTGQVILSAQNREEKKISHEVHENMSSSFKPVCGKLSESADLAAKLVDQNGPTDDIPTLAFPSISTADFQFNHEKAADVIVEKVEEVMNKLGNARLVLVDLSHGSKILSLVKAKASQKGIDSKKFFTFVGDITRLFSDKGLRCNVIANAANWRLKPGGGGVNAAIFKAAGSSLEDATLERAKSLLPGHSLVIPLPSTSPLYIKEKVTHVIHVLGPNMNPNRPNCLDNDYDKGCKVLRDTYTSLFEGFISIVKNQAKNPAGNGDNMISESPDVLKCIDSEQKLKRNGDFKFEKSKKCKGSADETGIHKTDFKAGKGNRDDNETDRTQRAWSSWAQALYRISMNPERHENEVLEIKQNVVVLNDLYAKAWCLRNEKFETANLKIKGISDWPLIINAQKHILVLARCEGLDCLADASKEHLSLLMTMHDVGSKWAEKFLNKDPSLIFRLGYHSESSMRQLHLHVISQDFNSKNLKNKKHWNSFNTDFFRDSIDVIEEIKNQGKAEIKDDGSFLSMELRCNRCKSAHPNIPKLKSHISHCDTSFPSTLLRNGRLLQGPTNNNSNS
ncbi:hypothetical protein ACFE04_003134 [Oxalis oulophora]